MTERQIRDFIGDKLMLVEVIPGWYIKSINSKPWEYQMFVMPSKVPLIRNVNLTNNPSEAFNFFKSFKVNPGNLLPAEEVLPSFPNAKIVTMNICRDDNS